MCVKIRLNQKQRGNEFMKKTISVILSVALFICVVSACSGNSEAKTIKQTQQTNVVQSSAPTVTQSVTQQSNNVAMLEPSNLPSEALKTQDNTNTQTRNITPQNANYTIIQGTNAHAVDGDTVKVKVAGNFLDVRVLLIDTPETKKPNTPVQPFGPEASAFTKNFLDGKNVTLELSKDKDKYGRSLAYVYVDGVSLQEELLKRGLARIAYVYEKNAPHLNEYKAIEEKAKQQKIGIWSIPNYVQQNGFHPEAVKKP